MSLRNPSQGGNNRDPNGSGAALVVLVLILLSGIANDLGWIGV